MGDIAGSDGESTSAPHEPPWVELNRPAPTGLPDVWPAIAAKLRQELQMDEPWTLAGGRTLSWWGDAVPLVFSADEPRVCQGDSTVKITASVTMVEQTPSAPAAVLAYLADLNRFASVGAYTYLEADRRIVAHLSHYAYEGNEALLDLLSPFALLLYSEAVARTSDVVGELGGIPAVHDHPESGPRDDFDDLMTVTETVVLPAGQESNRWVGGELAALAEYVTSNGIGVSTGQDDGVTAEFRIKPSIADDDRFSASTSLLQLLCTEHPGYSQGLLSLLRIPARATATDAARCVNHLNAAELTSLTGLGGWGAWCTEPDGDGIAHTAFLPNIFARPGLATAAAVYAADRAGWACDFLTTASP